MSKSMCNGSSPARPLYALVFTLDLRTPSTTSASSTKALSSKSSNGFLNKKE